MKELKKYLMLVVLLIAVVVLSNQNYNIAAEAETKAVETEETKDENLRETPKIVLVVNEDDCRKFMAAIPPQAPAVAPADYVAGVDVYGREVTPAATNIKEKLLAGLDIISISFDPIALQEIEAKGLEAEKINIGQLSLKDGSFVYADYVLDEKAKDMVLKACSDIIK